MSACIVYWVVLGETPFCFQKCLNSILAWIQQGDGNNPQRLVHFVRIASHSHCTLQRCSNRLRSGDCGDCGGGDLNTLNPFDAQETSLRWLHFNHKGDAHG